MSETVNSLPMTGLAASLADCAGADPMRGGGEALPTLCGYLSRALSGRKASRVLAYHPDAMAMWLYQKYTAEYEPILRDDPLVLPLRTVFPSVTPVCFASMYSGLEPAEHGVTYKEKQVIKTDTLFDALLRAGKRVAIVAVAGSSMSRIFEERPEIDRFYLPYDGEATDRALALLKENRHDYVALYHQEYDDAMHATFPESEQALAALRRHIASYRLLSDAAAEAWKACDSLVCLCTDHGVHTGESGRGVHGSEGADDLNILHFFKARPARSEPAAP